MAKKKILITGARGFIASNLINFLSKKKYSLYLTTAKNMKNVNNTYITIKNKRDFRKISKYNFDYVINLHGSIKFDNFKKIYEDHYKFNKYLIENINLKSIKKFIHIGSANEYGSSFIGYDKKYIIEKPDDNYGKVKLMTSNLIRKFFLEKNIPLVILRIFHTYGINQREPRLFPYLIKCIKSNKIAKVDTDVKKSFVHVEDICKIINIILTKKMKFSTYNLSINKPLKIIDILKFLNKKFGLKYQSKRRKKKSQYLLRCKLNNELKIRYKSFYDEIYKIFLITLNKKN